MPLVGMLEAGTVARILRSVRHAKADVLVLLAQEERSGHVLFEKGVVVMASQADLRGGEALAALEQWTSGHYALLKRSRKQAEAKAHVLLNGLGLTTRRPLERWLKNNEYATSQVGHPEHAQQVISYIQPEVVLMHCPLGKLGITCAELAEELKEEMHGLPPLLVVVRSSAPEECAEEGCVRIGSEANALEQVLAQFWPGTRLGVIQASQEHTAKVFRPEPVDAAEAFRGEEEATPEERLGIGARELLPMLLTLCLGSAAIWTVWFLLNL